MTAAVEPAEINRRDPLGVLTLAALAIALAAVATRMTVMELSRGGLDLGPAAAAADGPGVRTTFLLDGLCWLPAVLVLLRRAIDRAYVLRWNVSHLLLIALVAWVTLSAAWAGNRFEALVGAGTWWSAAALCWATSQLVRSWTRLRPVLGLAAGLSMVFVMQAVVYRYYELPETKAYWHQQRQQMIDRQGSDADDFAMRRFDQLVENGQTQGFYRSPNTFAAVAVLCGLITAGFAVQRALGRDEPVFAVVLALAVLTVPVLLWWTQSRTAVGVAVMAAVALPLAWARRGWLGRW